MNQLIFSDRVHAGQLLAGALRKYADRSDVMVLGLPRGGVPVAYEVAKRLHAPLDVMVVRKLGVPGWENLAMGSVASGGARVINDEVVHGSNISAESIERAAAAELQELHRHGQWYENFQQTTDAEVKQLLMEAAGFELAHLS